MSKVFSKFDEPISATEVAGVDIEYDTRFLDLQSLAEGKPEQQYGDVIIEAQAPDWAAVEKLSSQLLSETKDLRVLCLYTQALTARYGLVGFKTGCETICINLEKYWDAIYPKLVDEDGEEDPFYRINALSLLSSDAGIIKQVYESYLLTNGLSNTAITVKQAVNLLLDTSEVEYPGGRERLILDIRVSVDNNKPELVSLKESLELLNTIESIYQTHLPQEQTPDFSSLKKPITTILKFTHQDTPTEPVSTNIDNPITTETAFTPTSTTARLPPINTDSWRKIHLQDRKDVELVLEKVCLYFEEFEPSHPAPLFIRRIQRLMNMDFYDIIKDINPEGLDALEVLIGKNKLDEESTTTDSD